MLPPSGADRSRVCGVASGAIVLFESVGRERELVGGAPQHLGRLNCYATWLLWARQDCYEARIKLDRGINSELVPEVLEGKSANKGHEASGCEI